MGLDELEVSTIGLSDRTLLEEVGTREIGESPLLRNDDLLTSRELNKYKKRESKISQFLAIELKESEGRERLTLYWARRRASITTALFESLHRTERMI